jgi:hypothetical protein
MNLLLWVAQGILALLSLSGGAFKMFGFDAVASEPFFTALPRFGWSALGALEVSCALLLVIPALINARSMLPALAAAALTLESAGLAALYAKYSVEFTATNPLPWVVVIGLLSAGVAYGRYARVRASR